MSQMDSGGSGRGPLAGCCPQDNEAAGSILGGQHRLAARMSAYREMCYWIALAAINTNLLFSRNPTRERESFDSFWVVMRVTLFCYFFLTLSSPVVTVCTAQWLLYVSPGLTFNNSTFCPHSVFVCFVWI